MANVLTNLIPTVYAALDVVSRELVGLIPAVTIDADQNVRAAVNQQVLVSIAPPATVQDIVPATFAPDVGDQTIGSTPITITKSRMSPFRWTGEEVKGIGTGPGLAAIKNGQIAQSLRALANEIEADLTALFIRASRAYGTAGTTPFGGATPNLSDAANIRRLLVDNGAPPTDQQLVLNTLAGANVRSIPNLSRVSEAGNDTLLRQGVLGSVFGLDIRESAQIKTPAKGTGSAYTTTAAGFPVGTTSIPLITGTGTILAGDRVTFASDTNNVYVVQTGISAPGTIVLNNPGLRVAIPASATAVTVGNVAALNMAFHRSSIVLAARPPALPEEGDAAVDRMSITDPRSGLPFELAIYREYKRVHYEIGLAWGVALIKSEHSALLLG
jgi:hypothetical protein